MPIAVFAMLVFGICALLGAGLVEVVMRNFASEAGVPIWVFIIAPALLSMLFALVLYRKAGSNVSGIKQSMSRALLVAILTWLSLGVYISSLWCPAYRALGCVRDVAIVLTAVGGGPLLLAALIAGTIVGIVLKRPVDWLTYKGASRKPLE
jgi:small-conductance mechanosensitive channel